jgi:hypothetical protein
MKVKYSHNIELYNFLLHEPLKINGHIEVNVNAQNVIYLRTVRVYIFITFEISSSCGS